MIIFITSVVTFWHKVLCVSSVKICIYPEKRKLFDPHMPAVHLAFQFITFTCTGNFRNFSTKSTSIIKVVWQNTYKLHVSKVGVEKNGTGHFSWTKELHRLTA